jgi:hypothetical protein
MKLVKYSNAVCGICDKQVSEYFAARGKAICKPCVDEVAALMATMPENIIKERELEEQPCPKE